MGIQTMGSQSNGQQSHLQANNQLVKQNSWYGLTLDEVNNLLGDLGKPLGSMNLDELLQNVWTAEGNNVVGVESEHVSSSSSLQRQASMTLARALSGKTVDDVWREIQLGQKKQYGGDDVKIEDREMSLGGTTLEDFLVQAGLYAGASVSQTVGLDAMDAAIPQSFQPKTSLLSSSSISSLSDAKPGRKRDGPDAYEKALERRLRRKIKNRESAARSRARKQ
ncbi:abscisic acid-insensitive 5-like protein 2-like, partial [Trifolium medium]|nr:abscisic acid-insensitive 5-like protein 2-like [Trifolium medium]